MTRNINDVVNAMASKFGTLPLQQKAGLIIVGSALAVIGLYASIAATAPTAQEITGIADAREELHLTLYSRLTDCGYLPVAQVTGDQGRIQESDKVSVIDLRSNSREQREITVGDELSSQRCATYQQSAR